jgi:beta-glucosidase
MKDLKNTPFFVLFSLLLTAGLFSCNPAKKDVHLGSDPVDKVVTAMTNREKAELVVGTAMQFDLSDSLMKLIPPDVVEMFKHRNPPGDSAYQRMVARLKGLVPGAAGRTADFPALHITTMVLTDGPAGLRIQPHRPGDTSSYFCTAFPVATLLASSWDTALVRRVGEAMGNEVLEYGADVLLAPALNIHRNPLCGRNFEYYSEDPLIAGEMAAAMVNGIQSQGVGTSIKHFDANNQETRRMSVNTIVSQRALREIYLKGFRIAVEKAHPWTVMSAYNRLNGTYCAENHDLLTTVLRDDWGFDGLVMSDWGAGDDPVAMLTAGNDLIMPGGWQTVTQVLAAADSGKLEQKVLDENVRRILRTVVKTPRFREYSVSGHPDLKAHAAVAREAAAQGMILLKNREHTLPLTGEVRKIALFGDASYETIIGGTGSGDVNEAYQVSLAEGLGNAGYEVDASLKKRYLSYISETRKTMPRKGNWITILMGSRTPVPEMEVTASLAQQMVVENDLAVITLGRNAGEGSDRNVEGDFNLTDTERSMIRRVVRAFHAQGKKVVIILNIDGVVETVSWNDQPDAVLLAWLPGQEAGNAIADVLTGKVNPSGKLATTFPLRYEDEPSAPYFPGRVLGEASAEKKSFFMPRVPSEVVYNEDIYVGYRYFITFGRKVAYPFGYGLSYTTFDYNNLQAGPAGYQEEYTFSIDVKNTGGVAGREVVEVYLHAPGKAMDKPEEELKAFAKTKLLQPGETGTLQFTLSADDLASFDEKRSAWVVEPGTYEVRIGASSLDIRQKFSFTVDQEKVVRKVSNVLAPPPGRIERLKR